MLTDRRQINRTTGVRQNPDQSKDHGPETHPILPRLLREPRAGARARAMARASPALALSPIAVGWGVSLVRGLWTGLCFIRTHHDIQDAFGTCVLMVNYWRASEASETLLVVVQWKTQYIYTYLYPVTRQRLVYKNYIPCCVGVIYSCFVGVINLAQFA